MMGEQGFYTINMIMYLFDGHFLGELGLAIVTPILFLHMI